MKKHLEYLIEAKNSTWLSDLSAMLSKVDNLINAGKQDEADKWMKDFQKERAKLSNEKKKELDEYIERREIKKGWDPKSQKYK